MHTFFMALDAPASQSEDDTTTDDNVIKSHPDPILPIALGAAGGGIVLILTVTLFCWACAERYELRNLF